MLTQQQTITAAPETKATPNRSYSTDRMALAFLLVSVAYLLASLLMGFIGSLQYILPDFLRDALAFQKTRPLHVYLAISWIFTAAQGGLYYYIPRFSKRPFAWRRGVALHLFLQVITSAGIVVAFFNGQFGGREYLEFPPLFGALIAASWLPFAINYFRTMVFRKDAPVYVYSWTIGIVFFYITLMESYLWVFEWFRGNEVRDITVQWKALGSMVGSWNMLVYGTALYVMERMSGNSKPARSPIAFFFFFLGFTNLLFNWGHHTYVVPAAPWVKTVAYVISMTELLIFANLLYAFRKNLSHARRHFHIIPYRLFSFADLWIILNLGVAIAISIPALNQYTHGTHITVAHAMGTTIGINTMLLFGSVFYMLQDIKPQILQKKRGINWGIGITNIALLFFWTSLIGSGLVKIASVLDHVPFSKMMEASAPMFRIFSTSGFFVLVGLGMLIYAAMRYIVSAMRTDAR